MTDGNYTYGDYSIMYKLVTSLSYTPETNVTLCANCTQIKKKKLNRGVLYKHTKKQR